MPAAELDDRGLVGDRRWMVVDPDGHLVSQREQPRMALVQTALTADHIRLTAPGMAPLTLARSHEGPRIPVTLWGATLPAAAHPEGGAWLSDFLGRPCQLVRMPPDVHRPISPRHARPGEGVSFADGYPLLLTSRPSLEALNARLIAGGARPIGVERFRPNLVIDGCEPFAEDRFERIRVGGLRFRGPKLCERCVMITVDPQTGRADGGEILKTLADLHTVGGRITFGINLIHEDRGTLRVGDALC